MASPIPGAGGARTVMTERPNERVPVAAKTLHQQERPGERWSDSPHRARYLERARLLLRAVDAVDPMRERVRPSSVSCFFNDCARRIDAEAACAGWCR